MTELRDLAETVVGWAAPGEQVEAYLSRSRTTSIRAYGGQIESLSSAEPIGAGIRVLVDGRQGFAWVGALDEPLLKETLEEARDNAAFGERDEFLGLAAPDGVSPPEIELVREDISTTSIESKVDLAIELERMALARDRRVTGVRVAMYGDSVTDVAIATTAGITVSDAAGVCYAMVSPLVEDRGDTQIGDGLTLGRAPSELDLADATAQGVDRAARLLGATQPASRRVTVVLDPEVTAAFLAIIGSTLSGEAVLKGRSLFAQRQGAQVAAPGVTLASDPTDPAGADAEHYDGEGLARRRVPLITGGTLEGFLYDTYSARRAGRTSTASAARSYATSPSVGAAAITLVAGDQSPEALIGGVDEGVYVQQVSGLHSGVNPVSGDFSVGATGLVIRHGAFAEPFREATIASTVQRMLLDVVAVGADLRWQPSGPAGVTLVIRDVSLGGS
ncbi:MAG: TldD/PmbA family protein [Acidimicrobiales bacterium]